VLMAPGPDWLRRLAMATAATASAVPAAVNPLKRPAERQATLTEFARSVKPKISKGAAAAGPSKPGPTPVKPAGPASRRIAVHPARPPLPPSHEDDIEFEDALPSDAEGTDADSRSEADWIAPRSVPDGPTRS